MHGLKEVYIFLLVGGVISWKSAIQSVIAPSTKEHKFVACFEAIIQELWLGNFTSRFEIVNSIAKLLRIYCDNSITIFFSKMTNT